MTCDLNCAKLNEEKAASKATIVDPDKDHAVKIKSQKQLYLSLNGLYPLPLIL